MHVITLASRKGGVGKSLLTANLAVCSAERRERTFAIDLDPQGSLTHWGEWRGDEDTPEVPVDKTTPAGLESALKGLKANGYDTVYIDTAGSDHAGSSEAVRLSTLTIIPLQCTAVDFDAIQDTLAVVKRLDVPAVAVINQVNLRSGARISDAVTALNGNVAPHIPHRVALSDAFANGRGIVEMLFKDNPGSTEMWALWRFVHQKLRGQQNGS
jgi:chromosome partitioning protein